MSGNMLGGAGALVPGVDVSVTTTPIAVWSALLGIALTLSFLVIVFLPAAWVGGAVAHSVQQSGMGVVSGTFMGSIAAVLVGLPLSGVVAACVLAIPSVGGQQVATIFAAAALASIRSRLALRRSAASQAEKVR
ncbi:hypothetical protein BKG82_27100 [Mycobacteroides chelonae]|uniref:Uncharacterized protein n=1 Tax=Mycobacteroides chelonae TaxID=1774 RepID=A0A1S1LJ30_MYCCH|nr:hypothetical protein [Mycobacteroides chelonae]OHU47322.1 hypothetical protein BKG82_27100 [Mycobacteroides chelonae]